MQNCEDRSCGNVMYNRKDRLYLWKYISTILSTGADEYELANTWNKSSHPEVFLYLTRHSMDIQRSFIKTNLYSMSPDIRNISSSVNNKGSLIMYMGESWAVSNYTDIFMELTSTLRILVIEIDV